jgi:uncharacterized membrane protein
MVERVLRYGTERLNALSDGVFAIAMTLLVIDLKVPDLSGDELSRLPAELRGQVGSYLAYALSFYVIGQMWLAHHRLFRHIGAADARLLRMNLLLLMVIAVVPFPTSLLGHYGGQTWGVVPYAAAMVLLQVLFAAMWWWAHRHGLLVDAVESRREARAGIARSVAFGVVFAASIPLAFVDPDLAKYLWLLLAIVPWLIVRLVRRRTG